MAKPKSFVPKMIKSVEDKPVIDTELEEKLNNHLNDTKVHLDDNTRDAITYLRKDVDKHTENQNIHVSLHDKSNWNSKETPDGAQAKANKVLNNLEAHKTDRTVHITKAEKELFKDKYTKAETRNLLKHSLTGLVFLPAVNTYSEINIKYPEPVFNSFVYVRDIPKNYIYDGSKWIEVGSLFGLEVTKEFDGFMSKEDKIKLDSIEPGANKYTHPDNIDERHVSDVQIDYWNKKADNNLVDNLNDGLMHSEDKTKLDTVDENANYYIHPEHHVASVIKEDEEHRFTTDEEKESWNNKAEVDYVKEADSKILSSAKAFTDTKIAAMLNSTKDQLQVLRSLAFELKKDDVVKNFFDLFNKSAKNEELQDHTLNSSIHISRSDRSLLNAVKKIFETGINSDWNENDSTSLRYIENKPKSLPANGGNSDTVGGYTAEQLLNRVCFYDYTIKSEKDIDTIINYINREKGHNVLINSGSHNVEKELIIKASNTIFTGIGRLSKLLGATIKIFGNNNTIENITLLNGNDNIVNGTAIYVQGNDNIIRSNVIMNYNRGIVVEGSNNIVEHNTLLGIRAMAIELNSYINSNYGNTIEDNTVKISNIGITLLSDNNSLTNNHITKNKVLNCSVGISLSNNANNKTKTINNIISENIVMRGRGDSSEYLSGHKTIVSEFSSKNIISSNITSGKEIIAPNDILSNNVF